MGTPFCRTFRPTRQGGLFGECWYTQLPGFASDAVAYVRSYLVIQDRFVELLNYIEPSDVNMVCYSLEIQNLLCVICMEIEANFKAIFDDNGFCKAHLNIGDYALIEESHHLSSYVVRMPYWRGQQRDFTPFASWKDHRPPSCAPSLHWYQAYNRTKHSRNKNMYWANFGILVESMCALCALLSAQFGPTFAVGNRPRVGFSYQSAPDGFDNSIGGLLSVRYANDWAEADQYDLPGDQEFRQYRYQLGKP